MWSSILLLFLSMLGGHPSEANPDWGVGIILPKEGHDLRSSLSIWEKALPCAMGSASDLSGRIYAYEDEGGLRGAQFSFGKESGLVPEYAIREYDYEIRGLQVYALENGRVAIMGSESIEWVWVDVDDLDKAGFRYLPWAEFLVDKEHSFYALPEQGLNLRAGAGTNHAVVGKMIGSEYLIYFTGKREGLWMEVRVDYWPVHPCEGGEKATKKMNGWIKALDDKGFPNVWYATRGC